MVYILAVIGFIFVFFLVIMFIGIVSSNNLNIVSTNNKVTKKNLTEQIMNDLEVSKAIDIVKQYVDKEDEYEYIKSDNIYYYFGRYKKEYDAYRSGFRTNCTEDIFNELLLSKDFTVIKILNNRGNIEKIIDLSPYREKIRQEFEDLIHGLILQKQSYLKLNKYMKDTVIELVQSQKATKK